MSKTKTLCICELLAMVIVFVELSTQNICIYVVGNAKCVCKPFSKKNCIYELLAMSFVYIELSIKKPCVYMNCWQWLLFCLNCQHKVSVFIKLVMLYVYISFSAKKLFI